MTGPIGAAKARRPLAEVFARTGLHLPTGAGSVTVRCPMPSHGHPDRTPSMRLFLDDNPFYCFGCGARGDVIQWTRETEGSGGHATPAAAQRYQHAATRRDTLIAVALEEVLAQHQELSAAARIPLLPGTGGQRPSGRPYPPPLSP
ncbi:MAG: CHC2 zinc finger domain-containing protein [Acidimicrobiales bacterium]